MTPRTPPPLDALRTALARLFEEIVRGKDKRGRAWAYDTVAKKRVATGETKKDGAKAAKATGKKEAATVVKDTVRYGGAVARQQVVDALGKLTNAEIKTLMGELGLGVRGAKVAGNKGQIADRLIKAAALENNMLDKKKELKSANGAAKPKAEKAKKPDTPKADDAAAERDALKAEVDKLRAELEAAKGGPKPSPSGRVIPQHDKTTPAAGPEMPKEADKPAPPHGGEPPFDPSKRHIPGVTPGPEKPPEPPKSAPPPVETATRPELIGRADKLGIFSYSDRNLHGMEMNSLRALVAGAEKLAAMGGKRGVTAADDPRVDVALRLNGVRPTGGGKFTSDFTPNETFWELRKAGSIPPGVRVWKNGKAWRASVEGSKEQMLAAVKDMLDRGAYPDPLFGFKAS